MHTRHRIGHLFIIFGVFSWLAMSVTLSLSPFTALAISTGDVFSLSNTQRVNNGLPALAYDGQLSSAAQLKAQHMANNNYFAHTAPDGTTGWGFIQGQGYSYKKAGENLASSNQSASSVVQGWMNSSGHRANLLSSTYTEVGYGSVYVGDWTYEGTTFPNTFFVVALYAQPKDAPAPPPAPEPEPEPEPTAQQPVQQQASNNASSAPATEPEPAVEEIALEPEEVASEEPVVEEEPEETAALDQPETFPVASVTQDNGPTIPPQVAIFLAFAGLSAVVGGVILEVKWIKNHHGVISLEDLHLPHIG